MFWGSEEKTGDRKSYRRSLHIRTFAMRRMTGIISIGEGRNVKWDYSVNYLIKKNAVSAAAKSAFWGTENWKTATSVKPVQGNFPPGLMTDAIPL